MIQNNQSEFSFENERLRQTVSLAEDQLAQAKLDNEKNEEAILEAKREMYENASHSVSGLWTSDGFEDLVALSQYVNPIMSKLDKHESTDNRIAMLEKLIDSPYFARIDFKFEGENAFEKIYIGRSSLMEEDSLDIYVYDWRSPIAGMFYRFTPGAAYYEAPAGKMTGEINLKRQYEIKNGALEYFFDADVQIADEFLRKLLSQNTSSRMKTIVETIQKEQDVVIRDTTNDLIMVQGVTGSGKTSVALHRAAYLMYQRLASRLSADNIMIVSPNTVFERYISNVLPELGEDNVVSRVFEEILAEILKRGRIQTRNQFLEIMVTNPRYRDLMRRSLEFKTSPLFSGMLTRLAGDSPGRKANVKELYGGLFEDGEYFRRLAGDSELPECIQDIIKFTQENLCLKTLYYDDAAAMAFLKLRISGADEYKNIRQVVIDEAQDYYPLHYEIFGMLFPNAKYTVLGDINQTLEKREDLSLYERISGALKKKKSSLVTMDKSFRCTTEILDFSSGFSGQNMEIKSFNRSGPKPEIHVAADRDSLHDMIVSEALGCLEAGYQSVGLICKSEKNSLALFKSLKGKLDVKVIKNESAAELRGIFIIPVYMSKGLEFDAVLVCDADSLNYYTEDDEKFLYIASTRALHRLNLFCDGDISPFLGIYV